MTRSWINSVTHQTLFGNLLQRKVIVGVWKFKGQNICAYNMKASFTDGWVTASCSRRDLIHALGDSQPKSYVLAIYAVNTTMC